MMRRTAVVLTMVTFLIVALSTVAVADVFGLGPTLLNTEKTTVVARAIPPPVPSNIIGLESYALWGSDAGAAAAITYKWTVGHWMVNNNDIDLRLGALGGVMDTVSDVKGIFGVFGELEAARIGGVVLILRADGGKLRVNPGFKVNLVSVSF